MAFAISLPSGAKNLNTTAPVIRTQATASQTAPTNAEAYARAAALTSSQDAVTTLIAIAKETQTSVADASAQLNVPDLNAAVTYISSKRSRADGELARAQTLFAVVQSNAGNGDVAQAPLLAQAKNALNVIQGGTGRLAELERMVFDRAQPRDAQTFEVNAGAAMGSGFSIPWWGYVAGGVLIIGGAFLFGGKK